ncbi:efflux transporter periplasmic adaptor subunit [Rubrivivax gelatinosus]|nr:efflux transporter periplasmic adaptor subunit [Rubrivivax gelatinosus]
MPVPMPSRSKLLVLSCLAAALAGGGFLAFGVRAADERQPASAPKPALSVTVTQAQTLRLPIRVSANGNIAAWQEASVGTEANGLRLAEVRANVGDVVRRGQVLAVFAPDTVQADLAQIDAGVAEAEATLAEAAADAQRARELQPSGALSAQQVTQYLTAERTAQARLQAQQAAARVQRLRLAQTQVLAPDAGVISARTATVGAVLPAGQELFRLIRRGRLEWRAELPSSDLVRVKPGMRAAVAPVSGGAAVTGTVRVVAPTVDAQTRNGIVYVDLGPSPDTKAGMFARGTFDIGASDALTLPQGAVVLRDGFHYVLKIGPDSRVVLTKVGVGRRAGDRIEITSGLDAAAKVVAAGGGFLADGDTVKVVDTPRSPARTAAN